MKWILCCSALVNDTARRFVTVSDKLNRLIKTYLSAKTGEPPILNPYGALQRSLTMGETLNAGNHEQDYSTSGCFYDNALLGRLLVLYAGKHTARYCKR